LQQTWIADPSALNSKASSLKPASATLKSPSLRLDGNRSSMKVNSEKVQWDHYRIGESVTQSHESTASVLLSSAALLASPADSTSWEVEPFTLNARNQYENLSINDDANSEQRHQVLRQSENEFKTATASLEVPTPLMSASQFDGTSIYDQSRIAQERAEAEATAAKARAEEQARVKAEK
jgi:hypothetical protein